MGIKEERKDGVVYKTVNRYSTDRHIFLMPDVPHLMKTTAGMPQEQAVLVA